MVPIWPRADKLHRLNLEGQGPHEIAENIAEYWDKGYDALLMENHRIRRGLKGQTLIVKTAPQLRFPWAEFDLAKRHLPNLAASLAGLDYFGANYPGGDYFE